MSVITDTKEILTLAKKKYDVTKYISVLEEQIEKLIVENQRLNTRISNLEKGKFVLNSDHIELFNVFKENNYLFYEEDITDYAKKSIDLEIALSELLEHEYFERPGVVAVGSKIQLYIPDDKKIEFLQAWKKFN